jgi:hypothetical protein
MKQRGCGSVGRAQPCQGWGREFESRHPLAVGASLKVRNVFFEKLGGVAERPKATACKAVKPRVQIPSPPPDSKMVDWRSGSALP